MLQIAMIDKMARVRRKEIDREVFGLNTMRRSLSRKIPEKNAHLDLNIRLVLQPHLSLSIWLGRGV
ncbi:MAG: hypothetical protein A2Z14_08880 [Chloroflexi bacterium RBG_16_48_8]|nr:MAG: hypothetical protein A2Z14_08880 [Chloroflexi bacterium RBG_16_48_8]